MNQRALVIGSGFAGLSAAASLAAKGYTVTVLEKNATPGGRARVLHAGGFTFDMGPSWYWMPDVFEAWFARFGDRVQDHYELVRLDPSYQVIFSPTDHWRLPAGMPELTALFETVEPGAGKALGRFLEEAGTKYDLGMKKLVHRPSLSWLEYMHPRLLTGMLRTSVFSSLRKHVGRHFKDPRLRQLMEFPVLFLGATAERTPALYSLMNFADMALGTWYPMGGMGRIVEGMVRVATKQGVDFNYDTPATRILVQGGKAVGVSTPKGEFLADVVVATADYHHVDQQLLEPAHRSYTERYWSERVMAPSSLLFYLGFNTRLPKLEHHNLFFDRSLDVHAHEIYVDPSWPSKPLMYISAPSKTDPTVAPVGHENVFALIPIAPGLADSAEVRAKYLAQVLERMAAHTGVKVEDHLMYQHSYCIADFERDYNAFRGNAYGLANTLAQTAVLKPRMKSQQVRGLYFAGQLTVPGPGVPPALISGQVVADLISSTAQRQRA
ncbi:MAG: phytoene desaturase [Flavobacteriales bacterium]|nr:phytoene desaturase [Flavobacteriales bacterium]